MNQIENYYVYLGIPEESSEHIIRKAYYKKSKAVHPDKLKVESSEEFNKLKTIYDILSDAAKKAAYDKQLSANRKQEKLEAELTEKHRKLRERFRAQEKEAELKRVHSEKLKYSMLRKDQILRQDAEDVIKFDREMQAKRRKKMEDIVKAATQHKPDDSDTEYTEDEVMKMMGL